MKKIQVTFHTLHPRNYNQTELYSTLISQYEVEVLEDAPIHIYIDYPDFLPMHKDYRNRTNIHVSEIINVSQSGLPPDMNMFDYAIGQADFVFEDRYFNTTTQEESINTYIQHIFDAENPRKRSDAVVHLYYDTKDNLWDNYRFLQKYHIKSNSWFYVLLKIAVKIFRMRGQ